MNLKDWRQEYNKYKLDEKSLSENPFDFFKLWFDQAVIDGNEEPNAMCLTTSKNNIPSARYVLLKELIDEKFIFYTNYNSHKAKDIESNPNVSLLFFWAKSQRQVRITGTIVKGSREEAESYFKTRPMDSQIAAIASPQSSEIDMNNVLDLIEKIVAKGDQIKCPENWGSYHISATEFEFWQGQPARLHDRMVYFKDGSTWNIKRIAP